MCGPTDHSSSRTPATQQVPSPSLHSLPLRYSVAQLPRRWQRASFVHKPHTNGSKGPGQPRPALRSKTKREEKDGRKGNRTEPNRTEPNRTEPNLAAENVPADAPKLRMPCGRVGLPAHARTGAHGHCPRPTTTFRPWTDARSVLAAGPVTVTHQGGVRPRWRAAQCGACALIHGQNYACIEQHLAHARSRGAAVSRWRRSAP